ncbi:hypothetical protein V1460_21155 [Streptomyces sp. SCSIO 30461]|uniref:hypothetical protein n=1 Tax=Streptomyces sp. SCSIO 30461 TaxID=3118085 RepID=UPI0030D2B30F
MADSFPPDLIDAQRRLHETRTAYEALCRTLPWSVEPLPGWPGTEHPHTGEVTGGRDDSPGYTDEQRTEEARLRGLLVELSEEVVTHPHWATYEREAVVKARMALKEPPSAVAEA